VVERQLPKLNVVGSIPIARSKISTPVEPSQSAAGKTGDRMAVRVKVDRERCQGHARCAALAPELFKLDELGNAWVIGDGVVPDALVDKAYLATANCPELAIEVIEP
jgi:ferredoxin